MNKLYKLLSLIMTFAIITTLFSNLSLAADVERKVQALNVSKTATYKDAESARAVSFEIGTYWENNSTVTYAEYFKMLDVVVKLADESVIAVWKIIYTI